MRISDWSSDLCSSDLPVLPQLRQFDRRRQFGERGAAALLARLDDLRLDPLAFDALDDRAFGDHRLEPRDAQFGRLFDDPVEPRLLHRSETEPEVGHAFDRARLAFDRSEEHTSELQSLMRISYAVFCLKKKNTTKK